MPSTARRLLALALAVTGLAIAIAGPATVSASSPAIDAAESRMIALINQDRAKAGLVPYRVDRTLMKIAGTRSYDMATKHYFSHRQPDGRTAFDMISSTGITWYVAAEIIAWNNASDLSGSADWANQQWLGSSSHKAAIVSTSYNYFGVGLAIDSSNGHKIWTAVMMKAPDHTGGWVAFDPLPNQLTADTAGSTTSTSRSVTVTWDGGDIRLATLTSGFDHFQIRRQVDGGTWTYVSRSTTARSRTLSVYDGHTYRLSVRACDRRGNCGAWQYLTVATK